MKDKLIFEEKAERFTCSINTTSCEKFYLIETGEHTTSEVYYFHKDEKIFKPKLFIKREEGVLYSIDSFGGYWWMLTNKRLKILKFQDVLLKLMNGKILYLQKMEP